MKRHSWPNFLLASSAASCAVVALALILSALWSDAPLFSAVDVLSVSCVVLYFLSWGCLALGLTLTILWRDKYPTTSMAGPFLFVLALALLLGVPVIAIFSHPHSIA